jgi:hypothetical protein
MAKRNKRRVKQRAKTHQTLVKRGRRRRKHSKRKVGYGARLRRKKKGGKKTR